MTKLYDMLTRLAIDEGGFCDEARRVPMAAGITYKKHLIATGVNQKKTHPLMLGKGYRKDQLYMHAEIDVIRNALRLITPSQLTQCELHIVRVRRPHSGSKKWVHGLAKPCPGCARTIAGFGIEKVFWSENTQETVDLV
jgi:tRNA(Arg) A34 adenosine deaminase TadA